ncbi:NAD-dependent epimerase [Bacteroides sp. 224]|uniref:NAD-dependent epimerase n=1 Tax=Bacteroides sp. 224 TaxID=2302936 RepID=UPI0013D1B6C5|nr:NAD-dependent epimerase [Bacteroides sp. 224]NDV64964.1 NAD-dependent epimerase [Bacteroides sp. 224]
MKILVTGAAGFIGSYVCRRLLEHNNIVVGLDNLNDYYDVQLKYDRLSFLGINQDKIRWYEFIQSHLFSKFRFIQINLNDKQAIQMLFANEKFDIVCHLGAQAGVRYSLENPCAYLDSNINGFLNILEGCRHYPVNHLVYASSSSVYGLNGKTPFSEKDSIAHPVSLYAATKKSNELMAHTYSYLYKIPSTGLRFFTVYGPWGRPDMSPFLFIDSILRGKSIKIFNKGDMLRDFTYIDDIVEGVIRVIDSIPAPDIGWDANYPMPNSSSAPYKIFNIGNSHPVKLMDYIQIIENTVGLEAKKVFLPMQPGDVYQTNADTTLLESAIGFRPNTSLYRGIEKTVEWFKKYYNL